MSELKTLSYTTCNGHFIPLKNIDYVGKLYSGQLEDDGYVIFTKSRNKIHVNKVRDTVTLDKCRQTLITLINTFISK